MAECENIADMEKELGDLAFKWAQKRGLTKNRDDVVLTFKLKNKPRRRSEWITTISDDDWAFILKMPWSDSFRAVFVALKESGNEPIPVANHRSFYRYDPSDANIKFASTKRPSFRFHLATTTPICPSAPWSRAYLQLYKIPDKKSETT